MNPRHLLAVWNPTYTEDAMHQHLRLLMDWSDRHNRGEAELDDVYVWWARLRSANRMQALPHMDEILAIGEQAAKQIETHLYLTDFRSLYVALLADITTDNPLDADDGDHLPLYEHNVPADLYFAIHDIRRLVADDTVATVEELKNLRNVRYDMRPVSLYGGMTDLPLIVERPDPRLWFSDEGVVTDERLWVEQDASLHGGTDGMSRELRENLLGDDIWAILEHGTRAFLASGEATFRTRRHDPSYDFSTVTLEYAKAVETEVNALVFPALRRFYSKGNPVGRHTSIDNKPLDLGAPPIHQSLGTIINMLEHNNDVRRGIKGAFTQQIDAAFILTELPSHLKPIAKLRNPAAHSERVLREKAGGVREQVLGIGNEGLICRLARIKMRASA